MKRINWGKVAVSGFAAGLVWTAISILLLGVAGREFTSALFGGGSAPGGNVQVFLFAANIGAAVWATWLYAALRTHYGPGLKTGAIAGIAWWIIVSMQSAKWLALSPIPPRSALLPGILTRPSVLLAAIAAGWCYENFTWTRGSARQSVTARTGAPDA